MGFLLLSLILNFSYLSNGIRRSKIEEYLSNWLKTEYAVPQCPILGYLHLNINSVDILYECEDPDIENYAGDTTPHTCVSDINTVISELLLAVGKLFSWCNKNHMKANPEKKAPSCEFQNAEKNLLWWSLSRIKFNWKIVCNSDWFWA